MLGLADDHMDQARSFAEAASQVQHPATVTELARLTRTLTRYADRIAEGFGTPDDPERTSARATARHAADLLRRAQATPVQPEPTHAHVSALAQSLRAAAVALGCGLDLLEAHFRRADGSATTTAPVIVAPDTTRSLLHLLSHHTETAGRIALHNEVLADKTGRHLVDAAAIMRERGRARENGLLVIQMPALRPPERARPADGESFTSKLDGVNTSIQRLNALDPTAPMTSWAYIARATAITCQINGLLVRTLAWRARELGNEPACQGLVRTSRSMKSLTSWWKHVSRTWSQKAAGYRFSHEGPVTDASDLLLRVGRLTFDDPAWTPGPKSTLHRVLPADLAPGPAEFEHVALTAMRVIESSGSLAQAHQVAINNIRPIQAFDTHDDRRFRARWVAQLANRSELVTHKGATLIERFNRALKEMRFGETSATREIDLIVQRSRSASRNMTTEDFPSSIAGVIGMPPLNGPIASSRPQSLQEPQTSAKTRAW
ncbi:hypothetical protein [Actinomadura rayongensis]|uniref:Uncharacterized protein n=1 Tax=Actinomadura rayongensis TaxID=1429076 RepID=A0A6I4W6L7_9ACTN|nr:hypothetical protein [Actinomadura rayongensis]MXQ64933.1 hypothetical protein [Actinomadura rayongensis]